MREGTKHEEEIGGSWIKSSGVFQSAQYVPRPWGGKDPRTFDGLKASGAVLWLGAVWERWPSCRPSLAMLRIWLSYV